MYGSYGSYSSFPSSPITTTSSPFDITPSTMRSDTCAYPSWPRRSALSEPSCAEYRTSSYFSDDELFPQDPLTEEDDIRSVSSAGSSFTSPVGSVQVLSGSQIMEAERERRERAKEYLRMVKSEKEKRKVAKKAKVSSSSSRKSKRMAPIVENGE
ncbi:uncharacterized protein DNG_01572 [Cephalotrichum gorgonifer]|uniref:Uncharacterized protein n=1 Tax=Cephalotrichum gorgonifer TaxID=2041049 RepID=A0AAE8SSE4_9PEZI|nr:uncharacterized protein DNG_01572 [Cephalotrichum gorgonifer]